MKRPAAAKAESKTTKSQTAERAAKVMKRPAQAAVTSVITPEAESDMPRSPAAAKVAKPTKQSAQRKVAGSVPLESMKTQGKMTPLTLKPVGWTRNIEDYYPFTGKGGVPPSSIKDVVFVGAVDLNRDCASFAVVDKHNMKFFTPDEAAPWSPVIVEAPRIDERTGAVNCWYTMNDAYMDPTLYMVPFIGGEGRLVPGVEVYVIREEVGPKELEMHTCITMQINRAGEGLNVSFCDLGGNSFCGNHNFEISDRVEKLCHRIRDTLGAAAGEIKIYTGLGENVEIASSIEDFDLLTARVSRARLQVSLDFWQALRRSFRLGRMEAQRSPGAGMWKSPSKREQKSLSSAHGILAVCSTFELAEQTCLQAFKVRLGREPTEGEVIRRGWTFPPPDHQFLTNFEGSFLSRERPPRNPSQNWYQAYLKQQLCRYELGSNHHFAVEITKRKLCP